MSTPSPHRPSSTKTTEGKHISTLTASSSSKDSVEWPAALAAQDERHAQALTALEQRHHDRLAQLEERLAAAERATADLGGQLRELR